MLRDERGQVARGHGAATGIHESRAALDAVRASEEKYRTLFNSIDEGYCTIEVLFDDAGQPRDYRFLEANPAFERQTGLANAMGRTIGEMAPGHEQFWYEVYGHIATTGIAQRFEHRADALGRFYDVYAFRIGKPEQRRVAILFNDITERKRREGHLALLNEVSRELVRVTNIDDTMKGLAAKIGGHFSASLVAFAEIDLPGAMANIRHEWHRADVPAVVGVHRVSDFAAEPLSRAWRTGVAVIVTDTQTDPRMNAEPAAALKIASFVAMPVRRDGEWRFLLAVCDAAARRWRDDEVELIRELTTRISTRLERARAEEAVRESEARQAFLVRLADALRPLAEPAAIQATITRIVGEHLNVARVWLVLLDDDGIAMVEGECAVQGTSGVAGRRRVDELAGIIEWLRGGRSFVVPDVTRERRISDDERQAVVGVLFRAFIAAPVFATGRLVAMLAVAELTPRYWTADEVRLVEAAAERVWPDLQRAQAQQALHESEERKAFLLALADRLRSIGEPVQIMVTASEALGRHLGADRCGYAEIDASGEFITLLRDFCAPGIGSLSGRLRLDEFSRAVIDQRAGTTLVTADAEVDPRIPPALSSSLAAVELIAAVVVPIIKHGRYVAALFAHQARAREWTLSEVALIEDVAERTWDAVERARAEDALRRAHAELERRVLERTADLATANASLQAENGERRAAEAQIKALFQRLVAVQEEERRRLARDLHDQLGQQMTALRMNLEALAGRTGRDAELAAHAARTQQLAEELDRSVDFLTWDLRPAALDHLGLAAALEELVTGWSERFGIAAEFDAGGTEALRLSRDVETNFYRLVQEALHNILKHARATHVAAALQRRGGYVLFVLEDNGRGFTVRNAQARPVGLGLVSMKERAALIGGTVDIESEPGRGTTILVRVPVLASDGTGP